MAKRNTEGKNEDAICTYQNRTHSLSTFFKSYDTPLLILYLTLCWLCIIMFAWILIAPASWLIDKSTFHRETLIPFLESKGFFRTVPSSIVTKYQSHTAVHITHLLPGALWMAIAPFQLHPTWRNHNRQQHRILGYLFVTCSLLSTVGIIIIVQRNLTFVHDFPHLTPTEGGFEPHIAIGILLLLAVWFGTTIVEAVRMARNRRYNLHQLWMIRHVASGIWVAVQRFVLSPIYQAVFDATLYPSSKGGVPPVVQRQTFLETGVISAFLCIGLGEYVIHRIAVLKEETKKKKKTA